MDPHFHTCLGDPDQHVDPHLYVHGDVKPDSYVNQYGYPHCKRNAHANCDKHAYFYKYSEPVFNGDPHVD
jgi:hypothetical protein